ncbi:uncharacterized protein V1516DRAFT_680729 [Lipomyces oligophaga]|uniref:uncharacterized protein n=1 Tax=Lipomyces oligophaga TaxID=45792 RepID=UPI0034CF9577
MNVLKTVKVPRYSAAGIRRAIRDRQEKEDAKYLKQELATPRRNADNVPSMMSIGPKVAAKSGQRVFEVGDFVQVVKPGPFQGMIAKVTEYSKDYGLYLEGVGEKRAITIPKSGWTEQMQSSVSEQSEHIHPDHVRLVTMVEDFAADEKSGRRYAIVDELKLGKPYYDNRYRKILRERIVANLDDVVIPWPDPEEAPEAGQLATTVEDGIDRTFYVTDITIPPVPPIALDSLRKKFSRNRKPDLSEDQLRRLTPPEMPLTEAKKKWLAELEARRAAANEREESGEARKELLRTAKLLYKTLEKRGHF